MSQLTDHARDSLGGAPAGEFCATGLDPHAESHQREVMLQELIDLRRCMYQELGLSYAGTSARRVRTFSMVSDSWA